MNAKNYGVAQNRDRVFMVSILGKYYYEQPKPIPLQKRLKDYLELNVDQGYYLSDKTLEQISNWKSFQNPLDSIKDNNGISQCITTRVAETDAGGISASMILVKEATIKGYTEAYDGDGVYLNRPHQKRGVVQDQMIQTIKTSGDDVGVVVNGFYKQALDTLANNDVKYGDSISAYNQTVDKSGCSPTITTRPEGKKTAILPITQDLRIRKLTPRECWRLMGIDDFYFDKASQVVSKSQLYKQAGNGIVVDVFAHILKELL
jgi:DNA (cytosine-5)-methyltransferase 1